jgi:benzoyl-CoA reductase/2-hydroxyglutaryl-CoA dehydratase subunit BcrC/BadD/HgdB
MQLSFNPDPKPVAAKKTKYGKRRCKQCGETFVKSRPVQQVCSVSCAVLYAKALEEKKREREWQARKKKQLDKLKTYSQRVQEVRKVFQEFIRLRDKKKPCISCGSTESEIWDAGHFMKAELYSGLIFTEDNCQKQCRKCNHFQSGNETGYRIGLVNRIGESRVKALERIKDRSRLKKWSQAELDYIKKLCKQKIKYYKTLYR